MSVLALLCAAVACTSEVELFPSTRVLPRDCLDLALAPDGGFQSSVLWAAPDAAFAALCGPDGGTWLTLSSASNYATYEPGGPRPGTRVTTAFTAVRVSLIDAGSYLVDPYDLTFAQTDGLVYANGVPLVTWVPYLGAQDCVEPYSSRGVGRGDLTGTPFQFVPGLLDITGYLPGGSITYSNENRAVSINAGGYCGGVDPLSKVRLVVGP